MELEIKEILNESLVGNEIMLSDEILSFLKARCFICWNMCMTDELYGAYCDTKKYQNIYMDICGNCINKFKFHKCIHCKTYTDNTRTYVFGSGLYVCRYCKYGQTSKLPQLAKTIDSIK